MDDKKRLPLNLPKKNDQFEDVPFVNDLTNHQLKVFIKRLWLNLQELATTLDDKRKDISAVIDKILDGRSWVASDIDDRFYYGHYKGFVIQYDTLTNHFTILDDEYDPVDHAIQGISLSEIKRRAKEARK